MEAFTGKVWVLGDDIDTDIIPQGLNADIVRLISQKKGEPDWLLDFRLRAYEHWRTLTPPKWGHLQMPDTRKNWRVLHFPTARIYVNISAMVRWQVQKSTTKHRS